MRTGTGEMNLDKRSIKWLFLIASVVLLVLIVTRKEEDEPLKYNRSFYEDNFKSIETREITDSWAEIIAAGKDGSYSEKYRIGDTKEIDLGSEGIITMRLVAMDADELADGSGKAPMTWIAEDLLNSEYNMNPEATNAGGWEESTLRSWLRENIFSLMPSEVRNGIREVTKYSHSYVEGEDAASKDTIWIPSVREVFYTRYAFWFNYYEDTGVDYREAFPHKTYRKRRHDGATGTSSWWLRSACHNRSGILSSVDIGGSIYNHYFADINNGVVIGFCL